MRVALLALLLTVAAVGTSAVTLAQIETDDLAVTPARLAVEPRFLETLEKQPLVPAAPALNVPQASHFEQLLDQVVLQQQAEESQQQQQQQSQADSMPRFAQTDASAQNQAGAASPTPVLVKTVTKKSPNGAVETITTTERRLSAEEAASESSAGSSASSSAALAGSSAAAPGSSAAAPGSSAAGSDASLSPADPNARRHVITTTTVTVVRHRAGDGESSAAPAAPGSSESGSSSSSSTGSSSSSSSAGSSSESLSGSSSSSAGSSSSSAGSSGSSENSELADAQALEAKRLHEEHESSAAAKVADGIIEDPEVKRKRARLAELEHHIKSMQAQYEQEHDWLSKALHLISTLHDKSTNVRLHLEDVHKEMIKANAQRALVARELTKLEYEANLQRRLRELGDQMSELLAHAENTKQEMNLLQERRSEYLTRVEQVKGILTEIKQKSIALRAATNPFSLVAPDAGCPCHLPVAERNCDC